MISSTQIRANAPVFGSDNTKLANVDHMEGSDCIKLKKDSDGQHHFIPLSWVSSVDNKVHLNRSSLDAQKEWSTSVSKSAEKKATNEGMKHSESPTEISSTKAKIIN